jgi:3-hydroxyacyl-CoA dehydrogenase/enoyl-CoA hydratase/3-hydroxybutyryl-CoA epimerase
VVTNAADANIGSIFGWGFAPFKGGTLQYINDYGVAAFVQRSQELAEKYGERFAPPDHLLAMRDAGRFLIVGLTPAELVEADAETATSRYLATN